MALALQEEPEQALDEHEETALVRLLSQHYGDGLVYLRTTTDRTLLTRAMALDLVTEEGYLTPAGARLWRRRSG